MNRHTSQLVLPATTKSAKLPLVSPPMAAKLNGSKLVAGRALWIAMSAGLLALFVLSVPAYYSQLQVVCTTTTTNGCVWSQITQANVAALESLNFAVRDYAIYTWVIHLGLSLVFWVVGLVIFRYRSDEWIGLFASLLMVTFGATGISDVFTTALSSTMPQLDAIISAIVLFQWPALGAFLLVFPDGRFIPRWSWVLLLFWIVQNILFTAPRDSPLSILNWPPILLAAELMLTWGASLAVQIYRYRRVSTLVQRQQTRWLVFALSISFLTFLVFSAIASIPDSGRPNAVYLLGNSTMVALLYLPVPLSIGVAILRYRLWDIDVLINRVLVYGALTALVAGSYVLVVGWLGSVLQAGGSLPLSLLATALVAILFQPLRERLQRTANRLMYGERDEPYRVISRLGQRLEAAIDPVAVLPTIVETVAHALKLPYVEIALRHDADMRAAAAYGTYGTVHNNLLRLPLVYANETVGELRLAPRAPGEALTANDHTLLADLARQAGTAVHAVLLTAELERSLQRTVHAREEARRNLGSDLHDGLGHRLAGLLRRVESTSAILERNPSNATQALSDLDLLRKEIQAAIEGVRTLAHSLHPPELELLGLAGALRERAQSYNHPGQTGLHVDVDIEEPLPALPAAVESTIYYIAQEALTNVSRHSGARICRLQLRLQNGVTGITTGQRTLMLEIRDNGSGLPRCMGASDGAGLGLTSMQERAAELGGRCLVETLPTGGTRVEVHLPCAFK